MSRFRLPLPVPRRAALIAAWLLAALLLAVPAAHAAAPSVLSGALSAGAVPGAPGVPAAPAGTQSVAQSVAQATGLSSSQVTAANVCAAPAAGQAACAAQALVLRSDHARVHPRIHAGPTFTQVFPRHAASAASAAGAAAAAAAVPATASGTAAPAAGTPAYLQQAYDLTYLSQTAGASDTVAIVDAYDDPGAEADLGVYRSKYGLPACTTADGCFRKVNQGGAASPLPAGNASWEQEISLDLDAVSALCPNCHILLVEANSSNTSDLDAGIAAAVSLGANQISNSWDAISTSAQGVATFPGQSIIAATGDHGYMGAGNDSYPAAFPGVTAAGGTTLSPAGAAGNLRGFDESAWSLNSSGAGWGGTSGCDLNETKPAWQADSGCTGRAYSDVSADANPDTGIDVYDAGDGGWLMMGGTSLATPLIAAFEAVTGVNGTTAQWAYAHSALLNDPVSGSSGTCATAIAYICTAGTGYDGPTGVGSISGALVAGAPGIGGPAVGGGSANTYAPTVGSSTATLAAGIYPNGLDTSYYWQYGPTTGYGQQTAAADAGAGTAPAAATGQLSGLTPGVTYHYRLVATNSDGTTYGYDYTLATAPLTNVPPANTVAPSIGGNALQGQTLTVANGTWSPVAGSYAYQWQSSGDGGSTWASIPGAIYSTYQAATGDLGKRLRVVVTATNAYGSGTAASAAVGPVGSGAPAASSAPAVSGSPDQGQLLNAVSTWNPAGDSYSYQWQTSANGGVSWTAITGATAATYQPVAGDLGNELRVAITATNAYGTSSAASAPIGPIAANAPINTGAPTVTGSYQRTDTLIATAGSWSGTGLSYSYQWQRSVDGTNWAGINNANQPTYALGAGDEGDSVRVLVTATNANGTTSAASAGSQPIAPYPPANTVAPALTGAAVRGTTLNATPGTWTGTDNTYAYQWQRDAGEGFVDISGATASNYTLGAADEGAAVRVAVTATNPDASVIQASAATATVAGAPPVDQGVPVISGAAQRGTTLSAVVGSWAGVANSYAYQWQSSPDGVTWTGIAGATTPTYTVAAGDEGHQLRVLVSAANPDGTASAPSAATAAVAAAPPVSTAAPTVTGSAQRGTTLSSLRGAWNGVGNAYVLQWQRSADGVTWTNIAGATGASYTLAVADEGDQVRLLVSATNVDGSQSAASTPTATVASAAPVNTAAPVVTGTATRSANLTATVGTWNGLGNAYSCQWQRSADNGTTWTSIAGATGFGYTVAVADEGDQLRALVTAANADATVAAPSVATAAVLAAPPVNTSPPTLFGSAQRGTQLTSTQGAWSGIGNAYAYQWQRSADNGTSWTPITGATGASYTLAVADEGDLVRLLVTVTNPDATVSAATATTATVAASLPVNATAPTIVGGAERGVTLSSGMGSWSGANNAYAYQWQRSADSGVTWSNIAGATQQTYVPVVADERDLVRLALTASNPDGSITADSAATSAVLATPPSELALPTISGNPVRGQTLISANGSWQGVGNGYSYQWQRSPDGTTWTNIAGATAANYEVGVADEHDQLRVTVTATNADAAVSASSAATATVPAAPPVATVAPAVSGTAARGYLLNASTGTWSGIGNSLGYQWQRSADGGTTWTAIVGATGTNYTLGLGDEGTLVRILVTAANIDGTVSAPSAPTAAVAAAPPANTAAPTLAGVAQRGDALSSTVGAWSGTGNLITEQWQRSADGGSTWTNITNAVQSSYTLQAADEGDLVRVLVSAVNPDGSAAAPSPVTVPVAASPPVDNLAPTLLGVPQRTSQLTAGSGSWSGAGDVLSYQWQRSADGGTTWTSIAGATATSYTLVAADEGDTVRMTVTATNADGSVTAVTPPSGTVQTAPPLNSGLPSLIGNPRLGGTLVAQTGTWSPADVTYSYAWQRGDPVNGFTTIGGATANSYQLTTADVGKTVRVLVTATNVDGTVTATSGATSTVAQPPVNLTAPAVPTGTLMAGDVLTPDNGTWDSPSTYAYTWWRCPAGSTSVTTRCVSVSGGTTYTLGNADVGALIAVTVTATSSGGSTSALSPLTGAVAGQPLTSTAPPSITGNPQVPNTLSANPGSWSVAITGVSYQWDRCDLDGVSNCVEVAAGTAHYALSAADDGHTLVLTADVTSPGRTASAQSPPLTIESQPLPQATVLPVVSGTPTRTYTLSATAGTWTNSPTSLAYQWQRCDASGTGCHAIPGATQSIYQLTEAEEGGTVAVTVTAVNSSGSTTALSHPTGVVGALLPVNTHVPQLSQTSVQQGLPVSAGGAAWQTTSNTTYATLWERCDAAGSTCSAIAGATAPAYTPVAADVGHTLVAVITATDVDGSVPAASAPSQVVLPAAPRWRALPVLNATGGSVGSTLSITAGIWSGGPVVSTDTTAVMRCTSACVAVGSSASYTITGADVGAILRLRETAANAGGATVVWSAQYVGPVSSSGSASAVVLAGRALLRNDAGTVLAVATVAGSGGFSADAVHRAGGGAAGRHGAVVRRVTVRRAAGLRGRLRAWVCAVAGPAGQAPPPCTRQFTLSGSAQIKLPAALTGRLRIVVVRRGR